MKVLGYTVINSPDCPDYMPVELTTWQRIKQSLGIKVEPKRQRAYFLLVDKNTVVCSPSSYADLKGRYNEVLEASKGWKWHNTLTITLPNK